MHQDDLVAARPADGLRASFPTADVTLVTRALHQINVLNPATVCGAIEAFERRHGARAASRPPSTLRGIVLLTLRRLLASLERRQVRRRFGRRIGRLAGRGHGELAADHQRAVGHQRRVGERRRPPFESRDLAASGGQKGGGGVWAPFVGPHQAV